MYRRLIGAIIGVLLAAGPALAQKYEAPPSKPLSPSTFMVEWGIGTVFLVACLVVGFKPAKRSNLK